MTNLQHALGRFTGYRTPFSDEASSERQLFERLQHDDQFLLPVARQVKVFGVEKLDLLALDRYAVPWVFEFKREVAQYDAVAQLQTYASYVASFELADLERVYGNGDLRRNLKRAFKARFDQEMPEKLTHQVNLVLAAYDFSLPCRHALRFLDESVGLVIGQLKIDCLWAGRELPQAQYQWIRMPRPTAELDLSKIRYSSDEYFVLSMDYNRMPISWDECIYNEILPIPLDWKQDQDPITASSGVFVYLKDILGPDETQELKVSGSGLVAYGIVTGPVFNLWEKINRHRFFPATIAKLRNLPQPFWVMPMRWGDVRNAENYVEPHVFRDRGGDGDASLYRIQDAHELHRLKQEMGMDPLEAFCQF